MTHPKHHKAAGPTSSADATRRVRATIAEADAALIRRHPWLGRDDALATSLFFSALGGTVLLAAAWIQGLLPTWLVIVGIALTISILHEMEHDLIHDLYLSNPAVRFGVLATIWFAKGSLDPWTRMRMHLWHHVVSGQDEDIEERLIGLGLPWGPLRVLITLVQPMSIVMKPSLGRAVRKRAAQGGRRPDPRAHQAPWYLTALNAFLFLLPIAAIPAHFMGASWAWPLLVVWALPNMLRHAAIVILSTNSHYVGIERGSVVEQNQILDHPIFWPLQIFCWNFGATHVVHHFLVRQPFWRRTIVFPDVRQALVDNGVIANDLGTFARANQRPTPPAAPAIPLPSKLTFDEPASA